MKEEERIRILLCDPHPVMRFGIASMIQSQSSMEVVAEAGTAAEALKLYWEHRPDITLVDVRLPENGGVEVIRAVRQIAPRARFLILTAYEGDEQIHRALEAGAMGYLVKGMTHGVLMEALQRVHAGRRFVPRPITRSPASSGSESDLPE